MKNLNKLIILLTPKEMKLSFLLLFLMIITALLETFGVASIMPFIAVLTNPDFIETNYLLKNFYGQAKKYGIIGQKDFLILLGGLVLFLLVSSLSIKALTTYLLLHFVRMREYSIGKRLVESYLQQPYSWFLNRNSSDLGKSILSEVATIIDNGLAPVMNLLAQSAVAIALLSLLIFIDMKIAIIVGVVIISAYIIIHRLTRNFMTRIGQERLKANEARFKSVSEAFGAVKEIKIGGLEKPYVNRFTTPSKIYAKSIAASRVVAELPRLAIEAISFGGLLILILFLMHKNETFIDILPIIALYAFAGYRLLPALQQIYHSISILRFVGPTLDAMTNDLLSLEIYNKNNDKKKLTLNENIILDNVSYHYPQTSRTALQNININIPARSIVGFVGPTGSGKTTIIDLILGLLKPQKGSVRVDGRLIDNKSVRSWQNSIGYVPQNIYLADDSITANIALGIKQKDISHQAIIEAAKIANIHDFVVNELPEKYQTNVGERGVRLSGGQRQRIGIARAIYNKPKVLILDEATSALDNLTESEVMKAIRNLGKDLTIILITHRLSTVKDCDTIFLLEKGKITAQGNFNKLILKSKKFKEMSK